MKQLALIFFIVSCFVVESFAATINVKISAEVNAEEYAETTPMELLEDGWKIVDYDGTEYTDSAPEDMYDAAYVREFSVDTEALPYSLELGDTGFTFSINREGLVEMGVSVGDADASATAEFTLPKGSSGEFMLLPTVTLSGSGGDHASGWWSYSAEAEISVSQ